MMEQSFGWWVKATWGLCWFCKASDFHTKPKRMIQVKICKPKTMSSLQTPTHAPGDPGCFNLI